MNVDLMRRIDYWAGMPLCALVSGAFKLLPRRPAAEPRRVLLIELSEMGSVILAEPAMRKLRRVFDAELHFAIFARNRSSLALLKPVIDDNIFVIREDSLAHLAVDTLRFLVWMRKKRIDTVIDLELFSRFTALLTGLSGAANRIGFHAFHTE
ncbi:MAG: glycosyltransferase family 9 protein, partial [Rhodospirillales bacterium]|nr:glycosyltransferase family 9 protein [Rhodospirillales bacterium]